MESIGQNLRQARENQGLSIEQVSRETNISKHYLVALEEDHYEVFPGEPYALGFLHNYADHLGLNADDFLNRFRTLRIQEQPTPIEVLIKKPGPVSARAITYTVLAVVVAILVIFLGPAVLGLMKNLPKSSPVAFVGTQNKVFKLTSDKKSLDQRLFLGDTLALDFSGKSYKFLVKSLGDELTLSGDSGTYKMRLGDTVFLDLDGDAVQDVRFFLKDLSPGHPEKGAELEVERLGSVTPLAEGLPTVGTENLSNTPGAGSSGQIQETPIVIQQGTQAKPFSVDVVFRAPALFRYIVDNNLRQENFYSKGQTIHIDASKNVKLFVSNAGAVGLQVNGTDLELGKSGQVAVKFLEWTKDPSTGNLELVAEPLY